MKYLLLPLLIVTCIYARSQTPNSPSLKIAIGGEYSLLNVPHKGFNGDALGYKIGLLTEKSFSEKRPKLLLQLGLFYHYREITNYKNSLFYKTFQQTIDLTTRIKQHSLESQLLAKYRFSQTPISLGAGATISCLIHGRINQRVNTNLDSNSSSFILYNYEIKNSSDTHQFNRLNIGPILNIGIKISPKIDIDYFISYDLLNPSQKYINHKIYNTLNNTLCINFKFN